MENEILRVRVEPPLGQMPTEIARALFGRVAETPIEPNHDFPTVPEKFGYFAEPPAAFKSDEAEEAAYRLPFEGKLLAPDVAAPNAPFVLPEPFYVAPNERDQEDAEYANPVARIFYDAANKIAGVTRTTTQKLDKNEDEWDEPIPATKAITAPAKTAEVTFTKRRDADGTLWNEGFNASGELQSATVVHDDEDIALAKNSRTVRNASLTEFVKRRLDAGDSVEALAEFAARTDQATADEISDIGEKLRLEQSILSLKSRLDEKLAQLNQ